jgi:hypothetical protein
MNKIDNAIPIFVNAVTGRGILNGVINLCFSTCFFTPQEDNSVELDPNITCRLRMDRNCAVQLRDTMNELINLIEKSERTLPEDAPLIEGVIPSKKAQSNKIN